MPFLVLILVANLSWAVPADKAVRKTKMPKSPAGPSDEPKPRLSDFIRTANADWQGSTSIRGRLAELLELPDRVPLKTSFLPAEASSDGLSRECHIVTEKPEKAEDVTRAVKLVFLAKSKPAGGAESHWFRASLSGFLEKAFVIRGKRDESGKSVRGSGTVTMLDIDSPETKEKFQHELDFWVRGMYRKPAKTDRKPAASAQP